MKDVTILILIDGFLQFMNKKLNLKDLKGHNPYFNRWFSAIKMSKKDMLYITLSQSLF